MKSPIKVRVDIAQYPANRHDNYGKKWYSVTKWVFEAKTGRTLEHMTIPTKYSLTEARHVKKHIIRSYFE